MDLDDVERIADNGWIPPDQLGRLYRLLTERTAFSAPEAYKRSCLQRRIVARMRRAGCRAVEQYLELLQREPREIERLAHALTIHVSHFFRNPTVFERLRTDVLPQLFRTTRPDDAPVRLWSLGCAAGEEPYSLAMVLAESFAQELVERHVELVATDIDTISLHKAAAGCYEAAGLKELSAERRQRWFSQAGSRYVIAPELTELVTFRQQDLMQTGQYQPCQLVLCRNTLIYFDRPVQEKILQALADILSTGGILVLGKAESLPGALRRSFDVLSTDERIYRRV